MKNKHWRCFYFPKEEGQKLEIHVSTAIVGWQGFFKRFSLKDPFIYILP